MVILHQTLTLCVFLNKDILNVCQYFNKVLMQMLKKLKRQFIPIHLDSIFQPVIDGIAN